MTAITQRLLRPSPCPVFRSYPCSVRHFFSSSDAGPPPDSPPTDSGSQSRPSFSSYFDEVKATLQREPSSQSSRKSPTFSKPASSRTPPQTKVAPLEEIRRNLSEFRSRSAPPPPSPSDPHISLPELYRKRVISKAGDPAVSSESPEAKPSIGPYDSIRESLRQLQAKSPALKNQGDFRGKANDFLFRAGMKNQNAETESPMIIGGSGDLNTFFGKENSRIKDDHVTARRTGFGKFYSYVQLGEKLKTLRPERKKGKWFSLNELNERLVKLREMEETQGPDIGVSFKDLRDTLVELSRTEEETAKKKQMQRLDVLAQLGGTPAYMLSDPKDHLVEKYFHPDNMSSSEKLKLELQRVRDEFKTSESDCGSARVQVAQLTTKIKHLSSVLAKKDKHSRKGLQAMVQRRKKLLKYLRRRDWDSYCLVLSKLGLRDNPDIKA